MTKRINNILFGLESVSTLKPAKWVKDNIKRIKCEL